VKGAEVSDGGYVMLTQEELESVEPGRSRTIEISDFVDAADIDPVFYQKSYYLAPTDEAAAKPYALLVKAMAQAERIGVATFVMRGKQYLAAIRPHDKVLVLETMYFADEVRDPAEEIDQLPAGGRVAAKDLDMAVKLITSLTSEWKPKNYRDTYAERVEQLIAAKKKDREIVLPESTDEREEKVVDLLAALQASVEAAKGHRAGNARKATKLATRKADKESGEGTSRTRTSSGKSSAGKKSSTAKKAGARKRAAKKTVAKKTTAKKASGSRRRKAS
jgi:DNA end-binding protein Ku